MNNSKFKIILVDPDNSYGNAYIPTGLCYLSSYLEKYLNSQIEIRILRLDKNSIHEAIEFNPGLIGLTAFTHTFKSVCQMANVVKQQNPDIITVIGGQHISMANWSMPKQFDFGILGEGEETFLQLVKVMIAKDFDRIKSLTGIQYWENGNLQKLQQTEPIEPLDNIPFPDRKKIDNLEWIINSDNFRKFHQTGLRSLQITTSRGCPYKCKFCQPSFLWGKFRMHSAEYTAEEINYIHTKYGINAVMIEDDLFTGSKKRMAQLIERLSQKNLIGKIVYHAGARTVQIDKEWVELFKQLGVVSIEFGIESGSDEIIKYLKRGVANTDVNKRAINLLNDAGIGVHASFITASPPETTKDLNLTWQMIKWIRKNHQHNTCGICIATPLPGTGLWDEAIESGLIDTSKIDWDKFSSLESIPNDINKIIYLNKNIPAKKMIRNIKTMNLKLRIGTPSEFVKAIPRRIKKLSRNIIN